LPHDSESRYGLVLRALHWAIAFLIIALIPLGWYMVRLDYYDPWSYDALEIHKELGMVVLLLASIMGAKQIAQRTTVIAKPRKQWEALAAKITHYLLYALMLVVPATGYMISTSAGAGVSVFGLFEVPAVLPKSVPLRDAAISVHYYVAYAGVGLIAFHIAGALKHHFIERDDALKQMFRG
jgi:cytochrome b561